MEADRNIDPQLLAVSPASEHQSHARDGQTGLVRMSASKRGRWSASAVQRPATTKTGMGTAVSSGGYPAQTVNALKALLRERSLPVSGKKSDLIARLEASDGSALREVQSLTPSATELLQERTAASCEPADGARIDLALVDAEVDSLCRTFGRALVGEVIEGEDDEGEGEGDDEAEEDGADSDSELTLFGGTSTPAFAAVVTETRAWVDSFILSTRRKSGRLTESSVLRLWWRWLKQALAAGTLVDIVVDLHHIVEYLKYAGTRKLLNSRGREQNNNRRLSAASLKKIMTMLGRVRRRQVDDNPSLDQTCPALTSRTTDFYKVLMVQAQRLRLEEDDFDITQNTILESQLLPVHFEQVKKSIFTSLNQLPSVVKAHFVWTWQCTTLNRGDELANLPLCCVQPHQVLIPDYTTADGRRSGHGQYLFFGVLSLYHEMKVAKPGQQEPDYNFVLPHRDPLRCPVAALAILLHFAFDQEQLVKQVEEWKWSHPSLWRKVRLVYGRKVGQPCSEDALRKMYGTFLEPTTIKSSKKLHLARRSMPSVMEDMGVSMDEIDGVEHWKGNTRREVYAAKIPKSAVTALAGFFVGEQYHVPWATVEVPTHLQAQLFPFVEEALIRLHARPAINHRTINFLELLQQLRPFFWRAVASIHQVFPTSALFKRLSILQSEEAKIFLSQWPAARQARELESHHALDLANTFSESATQSAFMALSARHQNVESELRWQSQQLGVIARRTAQFSPSALRTTMRYREASPSPPSAQLLGQVAQNSASAACCHCQHNTMLALAGSAGSSTPLPQSWVVAPTAASIALHAAVPSSPSMSESVRGEHLPSPMTVDDPTDSSMYLLGGGRVVGANGHHVHVPIVVVRASVHYDVLPLTPGLMPLWTAFDPILPPSAAFHNADAHAPHSYPVFMSSDCSWNAILGAVRRPGLLWKCWAPMSLGEYDSVSALWEVWVDGAVVEGVGRKPPLRDMEEHWGSQKNKETNKGRQQSWRPHNDPGARQRWAQFMFFVTRVENAMDRGRTSIEAVQELDTQRGSLTVCQFRRQLQPKKKKKTDTAATIMRNGSPSHREASVSASTSAARPAEDAPNASTGRFPMDVDGAAGLPAA